MKGTVFAVVALAAVLAFVFLRTPPRPAGNPPAEDDPTANVPPGEPVREQPAAGGEIATNLTSSTEPENAAANTARLISILLDANQPLEARIAAAKTLAGLGTDEAMAALKTALAAAHPDALRAAIAEALGQCPHPDSQSILLGLLSDASQNVVKAAIHALARQDSPKALEVLNQLLGDSLKSAEVRSEAALALASMTQPGALEALTHAVVLMDDEDTATQILDELGQGSIDKLQPFFKNYLLAPNVSTDLKVTAIESLSRAEGEVGPFLSACLDNADSQLRAAAAWALSDTENPGDLSSQLTAALQREADPEVRRRLFQALGNQDNPDWQLLLPVVQKETDVAARVAGWNLLAGELRGNPSSQSAGYFDQTVVPELKQLALTGTTPDLRKEAVLALKIAHTPAAMEAVQYVSQNQPADPHPKKQNP